MADLWVVVVAYHGAAMLDTCLAAVAGAAPVVVVDNSADADVAAVARRHGAGYVDAGGNRGFAAGVNIGLDHAPAGADVLLLNPDAVFPGEAVRALHAELARPGNERVAALSPALRDPRTGEPQRVRWPLPTPARMWREALGLARLRPPPEEFCVGAVLLLRGAAVAEVGRFDERFFLYAEETDWQRRALAAGWRTAEVPGLGALHEGAGTSTDSSRREVLFHAGTETYLRKWYGRPGWSSYRAAVVAGALPRALLLPGDRGRAARNRAALYLRGPRATAGLAGGPATPGRRVAHVVVTRAFAGVERYVCEVAAEQAARGSVVTVIGGDPARMPAELGAARHRPAGTLLATVRELARLGRQDVVHVHMTAAELAAVVTQARHHARIVSTRHFAGRRGSSLPVRLAAPLVRRRIRAQIAISRFVARSIGEPATVLPNGVRARPAVERRPQQVVLCLQRLEAEKATDVALRAWALSGLGERGWELHLAGAGAQRPALERLAGELGIAASTRWLGRVDDTGERLRRAAALLATATAEPFGLSVAEAMAAGTPVIASEGGAHPELLGDEGWTFPAGDAAAAAALLQRLAATDAAELRDHGQRLAKRQQDLFELGAHVTELDRLYGRLG